MRGELQGLGPFRLAGVLGEGERAIVYDAEREGVTGVRGALKVLRDAVVADEYEREAFSQRARVGGSLEHPRIVPVLDTGVLDGAPWALLERVDAVALLDLFPKRGRPRFSEEAGATLLSAVLEALSAAAEAGVVHGRLDPSNVLVDLDGDVRVTGFGADGDPRSDFLDLTRLAQSLTPNWSAEMDSWIDGLQDGDDRFAGPADALAALPVPASEEGRKALGRAAKRARRKRERELAEERASQGAPSAPEPVSEPASPPPKPERRPPEARRAPRRTKEPRLDSAIRQARWVGYLCGGLLLAGLVIEILGFSG